MIRRVLIGLAAFLSASSASATDRMAPHPDAATARELMGLNNTATLTHAGIAVEILQTRNYVFIRAEGDGRHTWLAAPRQEVAVGSGLRWGDGVEMQDFKSKQLDRFFHTIMFIDRIEVAPVK